MVLVCVDVMMYDDNVIEECSAFLLRMNWVMCFECELFHVSYLF